MRRYGKIVTPYSYFEVRFIHVRVYRGRIPRVLSQFHRGIYSYKIFFSTSPKHRVIQIEHLSKPYAVTLDESRFTCICSLMFQSGKLVRILQLQICSPLLGICIIFIKLQKLAFIRLLMGTNPAVRSYSELDMWYVIGYLYGVLCT